MHHKSETNLGTRRDRLLHEHEPTSGGCDSGDGDDPRSRDFGLGYFGASTGGAAALLAAAAPGLSIGAVVSRGGRPDLAGDALPLVKAPTLLIVGERDEKGLRLNEDAYAQLRCEKKLEVVPRATHLFEQPGALEEVARFAARWFQKHLRAR